MNEPLNLSGPFHMELSMEVHKGACFFVMLKTVGADEEQRVVTVSANRYHTTPSGMCVFEDDYMDRVVATIAWADINEIKSGWRAGHIVVDE